ncbi:zf-CHY-domain-containing protein [Xylariaceae sp. FL0662B]|nr:zf-CHY-domain-containing protein [Xylariaceae sp. FL0662B]
MTSLVADFLVNPVIRQARRFSLTSSNLNTPESVSPPQSARKSKDSRGDFILEVEEDKIEGNPSFPLSSQRSVQTSLQSGVAGLRESSGQSDDAVNYGSLHNSGTSTHQRNYRNLESQGESMSSSDLNMDENRGMSEIDLSPSRNGRRRSLPEDDGMGLLRRRIFAIQVQDLNPSEKARRMHHLLMEGYTKSQRTTPAERPLTPSSPVTLEQRPPQGPLESLRFWQNALGETEPLEDFILTPEDVQPTFAPVETDDNEDAVDPEYSDYQPLGCEHYRRNVKLQCSTCNRWYTCRFCHDKVEDHTLIRKDTKNMLCMLCGTAQRASEACIACGASAARYYCSICKLWNDNPDKPVYHCNDCGICRIGRGLGKDFFHCKTCCACIAIGKEKDHKCIERSTDCDCPICGEYMFTSPKALCFMKCGHSIHRQCLDQHMKVAYKCPICNKSLANMELQFRNLDIAIQTQPMPPEFQDTRALILCNDCSAKSSVKYHWLGLKCGVCQSYNTAQLRILGLADEAVSTDFLGRDAEFSRLSASGNQGPIEVPESSGARDIRRRHSSNVARTTTTEPTLDPQVPDRLARSVSPVPNHAPNWNSSTGSSVAEEEEDEDKEDILGFWRRLPRSIASNDDDDDDDDNDDDEDASEEESVSSSEEEIGDEDEDDDLDDFELLGHR